MKMLLRTLRKESAGILHKDNLKNRTRNVQSKLTEQEQAKIKFRATIPQMHETTLVWLHLMKLSSENKGYKK